MCLFYESARKQADRQTDRQTKAHLFLPPPLSHLFGFVLFFRHCAVLLFSLRDETQDAALCCLSASNSCTPLPHSLHTSIASFPPLVLPDPCACFLSVHSSSTQVVLSLHLCFSTWPFPSVPPWSTTYSFGFIPFFSSVLSPLFYSFGPQHDSNVFLPSAAASLWCWPVLK